MTKTSAWGEGSCTRSRGVSRLEGDPPRPLDCDASPTARFGGEGCRASGIRCEYVEESVPPPARPSPTSACTSSPRPQCSRERWINPLYTVSSPWSEASASYWSRCIGAILSHRRSRRGPRRGRGADSPTIAAGLRRHIRPHVPSQGCLDYAGRVAARGRNSRDRGRPTIPLSTRSYAAVRAVPGFAARRVAAVRRSGAPPVARQLLRKPPLL
jgi:hypothetical protein